MALRQYLNGKAAGSGGHGLHPEAHTHVQPHAYAQSHRDAPHSHPRNRAVNEHDGVYMHTHAQPHTLSQPHAPPTHAPPHIAESHMAHPHTELFPTQTVYPSAQVEGDAIKAVYAHLPLSRFKIDDFVASRCVFVACDALCSVYIIKVAPRVAVGVHVCVYVHCFVSMCLRVSPCVPV